MIGNVSISIESESGEKIHPVGLKILRFEAFP